MYSLVFGLQLQPLNYFAKWRTSDALCSSVWLNSRCYSSHRPGFVTNAWLLCALATVSDCCPDIGAIWEKQAAKQISHPSSLPSFSSSSIRKERNVRDAVVGAGVLSKCQAFSSFTLKGLCTDRNEISRGLPVLTVGFLLTAQLFSRLSALPLVVAAS